MEHGGGSGVSRDLPLGTPWEEQTLTAPLSLEPSSCRAKIGLKPIAYAKLLDLSKGSYLLFFTCHEHPLCRRSKWIQALITLQGE